MGRLLTVQNVLDYQPKLLDFTGEWLKCIGRPEQKGSWLIWGRSANGKSRLCLQLAAYLTQFGKVIYDPIEEGLAESLKRGVRETGMANLPTSKIHFADSMPMDELLQKLEKKGSANFIFIDSLQHSRITKEQYLDIIKKFNDKIFIFVSHADGMNPKGDLAEFILYDSNVSMRVENFEAHITKSRYGGSGKIQIKKNEPEI